MDVKILPSITTTNQDITKIQLKELSKGKINELGLFITGIKDNEERFEFLQNIKTSLPDIKFPFIHARIDSSPEELNFCMKYFQTKWFNIHANHANDYKNSQIYIFKPYMLAENSKQLNIKDLKYFHGICLDLSHWHEDTINDEEWVDDMNYSINKYPIICNHVSAVKSYKETWVEHIGNYNSDFDYLKKIPKNLFATEYTCLELENTIGRQLEIIEYIKTI